MIKIINSIKWENNQLVEVRYISNKDNKIDIKAKYQMRIDTFTD